METQQLVDNFNKDEEIYRLRKALETIEKMADDVGDTHTLGVVRKALQPNN